MSPPPKFPRPIPGWPADKIWPPGRQSLDDAFDKLRWAKEHLKTLRAEIEPFEQQDTHTIGFEVDPDAGEYTFHVHGLSEVNADWGLMIGDCLHNARTALDYLMVRLYSLVFGDKPEFVDTVQFPIYNAPKSFNGAVGEIRKEPAFSGYLARIEELQPFNSGNRSIWGEQPQAPGMAPLVFPQSVIHALPKALHRLSALDNIDKHRVVNASWLAVKRDDPFAESVLKPPPDFKLTGGEGGTYIGPLEDGTQVGGLIFETPLPGEWEPSEMEMKRQFPLHVALYNEDRFSAGVLEVLPFCIWGVESVLAIFGPVFEEPSNPPLPVTAIPNVPFRPW